MAPCRRRMPSWRQVANKASRRLQTSTNVRACKHTRLAQYGPPHRLVLAGARSAPPTTGAASSAAYNARAAARRLETNAPPAAPSARAPQRQVECAHKRGASARRERGAARARRTPAPRQPSWQQSNQVQTCKRTAPKITSAPRVCLQRTAKPQGKVKRQLRFFTAGNFSQRAAPN